MTCSDERGKRQDALGRCLSWARFIVLSDIIATSSTPAPDDYPTMIWLQMPSSSPNALVLDGLTYRQLACCAFDKRVRKVEPFTYVPPGYLSCHRYGLAMVGNAANVAVNGPER